MGCPPNQALISSRWSILPLAPRRCSLAARAKKPSPEPAPQFSSVSSQPGEHLLPGPLRPLPLLSWPPRPLSSLPHPPPFPSCPFCLVAESLPLLSSFGEVQGSGWLVSSTQPTLMPRAPQGHLCPHPPALGTPASGIQAALSVHGSDSALSFRPQGSRSQDIFLSASPALIPKVIFNPLLSWLPPATSPSSPCSVSQVPGSGVALLSPKPHRTTPPASSLGFRNSAPVSPLVHLCSGRGESHTTQPKQNAYFHPKCHFFSFPAA